MGVCFSLPIFLFSNFDKLVEGKTFPDWVAENGWWSMTGLKFVALWLLGSTVLSLSTHAAFTAIAGLVERRKDARSDHELKGTIFCVNTEFVLNAWQDKIFYNNKTYDYGYDCAITLKLSITNDSTVPMTVTGFRLELIGTDSPFIACSDVPVEGYFTKRTIRSLGGPPHKVAWDQLKAFPLNTQIMSNGHAEGWLRFHYSLLLPHDRESFYDKVQLKLVAVDGRRKSHPIYEGAVRLPECGIIADSAHLTDQWDIPIRAG